MTDNIKVVSDFGPFTIIPEWIVDLEVSSGAFRLYALLGMYADWRTGESFPSRSTLADRLRASTDSVDRWTAELVGAKALEVERRLASGDTGQTRNLTNIYRLLRVRKDTATRTDAATPSRMDAATPTRKGAALTITTLERDPLRTEIIQRVFQAWLESTGKDPSRTRLDEKRRRKISVALDAYSEADVVDAVRGWANSPFHSGKNDRKTIYNDLTLLLRDSTNIERFRDLARQGQQHEIAAWTTLERMIGEIS